LFFRPSPTLTLRSAQDITVQAGAATVAEFSEAVPAATLATIREWDRRDPIAHFRGRFALPADTVYLDGNSLGALSVDAKRRLDDAIHREWGQDLIRSWNVNAWIDAPLRVGAKIAHLIGAGSDEVIVADSTSINLFKLIFAATTARPGRVVLLSEPGNFPTDLYMLQGAVRSCRRSLELRLEPAERILESIDSNTALVVLTHVHYKSSVMHDMHAITQRARDCGALVLWDLSHSAGAIEVDLNGCGADMAVGCGYKYLNGGPGAPAFMFLAKRHHEAFSSPLSGWMGHRAPFEFDDQYAPAPGMRRFLCGTPPILGLLSLEAGVDLMLECGIAPIVEKSRRLSELFIGLVGRMCPHSQLRLASPRDPRQRGSHIALAHPNGYAIMQALIERRVIGDFRAPDILRFGFTPLYTRYEDIWIAAATLADVLGSECWADPRYAQRAAVT
jgi:kynureninase